MIQKLMADNLETKPNLKDGGGPSVLTLDHLGIGFCIWAIVALIAFIVFCLELLKHWIKMKLHEFAITNIKKSYLHSIEEYVSIVY